MTRGRNQARLAAAAATVPGSLLASAPGKLMLSGEYAILDGAPAVLTAVDRRAVARLVAGPRRETSSFLEAAAAEIARVRGPGPAADAARRVVVDSSALYDGAVKYGLGSSAATTVAAIACALAAEDGPRVDRALVRELAARAHAEAQGARGVRGSGADIATSTYGGVIELADGHVRELGWPAAVRLVPVWAGASADTTTLVTAVTAARAARPAAVEPALRAIGLASAALIHALRAGDAALVIEALAAGGRAVDALGQAAGVDLTTEPVRRVRAALAPLGGTCKSSGAGGGDVAIAAVPAEVDRNRVAAAILQAGCTPLDLSLAAPGVDILRPAE